MSLPRSLIGLQYLALGRGHGFMLPRSLLLADLTALAKNNGEKFPAERLASILRGRGVTAHGGKEMPAWGPVFWPNEPWPRNRSAAAPRKPGHYIETLPGK